MDCCASCAPVCNSNCAPIVLDLLLWSVCNGRVLWSSYTKPTCYLFLSGSKNNFLAWQYGWHAVIYMSRLIFISFVHGFRYSFNFYIFSQWHNIRPIVASVASFSFWCLLHLGCRFKIQCLLYPDLWSQGMVHIINLLVTQLVLVHGTSLSRMAVVLQQDTRKRAFC